MGVASRKFLGYMVNQHRIEANLEKIKAFVGMGSSSSPKKVQSLTRSLAALNRFISKATDRCQLFFQTIKEEKQFEWTKNFENTFRELKTLLRKTPLLSKPKNRETLLIYLAVSEKTKPDTSRRLIKWSIELSEFDIFYKPRPSIKGQALADFMAEFVHIPEGLPEA
ncbi:Integrase catalytic domain-containing protein [Abeliophyllum distichum]|uniref:Integrase catalytic domain-containing protein n=1 Tax=Abeliophyllum distichum TaxID=126358 RepID=A0ABD1RRA3_9LAMI